MIKALFKEGILSSRAWFTKCLHLKIIIFLSKVFGFWKRNPLDYFTGETFEFYLFFLNSLDFGQEFHFTFSKFVR